MEKIYLCKYTLTRLIRSKSANLITYEFIRKSHTDLKCILNDYQLEWEGRIKYFNLMIAFTSTELTTAGSLRWKSTRNYIVGIPFSRSRPLLLQVIRNLLDAYCKVASLLHIFAIWGYTWRGGNLAKRTHMPHKRYSGNLKKARTFFENMPVFHARLFE